MVVDTAARAANFVMGKIVAIMVDIHFGLSCDYLDFVVVNEAI